MENVASMGTFSTKVFVIHEIHPIEGMNFMQGGSRPAPTENIHQSDKLKFELLLCSNESGGPNGVTAIAGQSGSHWLAALADKLKFECDQKKFCKLKLWLLPRASNWLARYRQELQKEAASCIFKKTSSWAKIPSI